MKVLVIGATWTKQSSNGTVCIGCNCSINSKPLSSCPEQHKVYYQKHLKEGSKWYDTDRYRLNHRKRCWKLKRKVIEILGGSCVVCGITDIRVLQLNHLLEKPKEDFHNSLKLYSDIISGKRNKEEFDLRCSNHNIIYEYEKGRLEVL